MGSCPKFLRGLPFLVLSQTQLVCAEGTPYLQYQAPEQAQTQTSLFSTWSYVFSLGATFLVVLGLAYLTSRLVANKMKWSAGSNDGKIISCLAFGSGRGVYLVEFAGRYLILGITEHNINLLKEVSDEAEIAKLKALRLSSTESLDLVFKRQFSSLHQISQKFPRVFKNDLTNFEQSRRSQLEAEKDHPEKR
jgi:flagellar protein FliO/FliZ